MKQNNQYKNQILSEIEELLQRKSIKVRYEKGDFRGGLCIYNDQMMFIINKRLSIDQKLQLAKSELSQLNFDDMYIRPNLREFLEDGKL